MPNGGPDCCGNCGFNKAVQEMAHPHPDQREKFWALCHCTLRNVHITNPFWTYCGNFYYGKIQGWIFASGLYEGYVRIPWHGNIEPQVSGLCVCTICGRTTEKGISVCHEGTRTEFCTNRHYIDWWKTQHDDPEISSDDFEAPEEFYGEIAQNEQTLEFVVTPEKAREIEQEERDENEKARQRVWGNLLKKNPAAAAKFGITSEKTSSERAAEKSEGSEGSGLAH